jgi:DNA repair protein SbcC/Rad50
VEILSLTLKNFKTHSDRHFTFQPGTNAISGENGAGKTSLLEAIAWVLFDHKGDYKTDDLIRNGTNVAQATVQFVSSRDQRTYEVQRNTRSGYTIFDPQLNEKLNLTRIKEEVHPWLRENMGVAPGTDLSELFATTIGVPQGTYTVDFLLTGERRKAIFDRVLKVEEYQKTNKDLLSLEKFSKAKLEAIEREIAQYEEALLEWDGLKLKEQTLTSEITTVKTDLTQWKTRLTQLQTEQQKIQQLVNQIHQINQTILQTTTQIQTQTQTQERLATELQTAQQSVAICTDRRETYQAYIQTEAQLKQLEQQRQTQQKLMQQRQNLAQQLSDRASKLATLEHQIDRFKTQEKELQQIQPKLLEQTRLEAKQQQTSQLLQQHQAEQQNLLREEKRLSQLKLRQTQAHKEITQLETLGKTLGEIPELEALRSRYQQQLSRIAAATQFETELQAVLEQAEAGQLTEAIALLKTLPNQAHLNQLHQFITSGETARQEVIDRLEGIMADLGEQVERDQIQRQIDEAGRRLQTLRQQQSQYLTLEGKRSDAAAIAHEITEVTSHVTQVQAQQNQEPAWRSALATIQAEIQALEDPKGRSRLLERDLRQRETIEQQLGQLRIQGTKLEQETARIDRELTGFTNLTAELAAIMTWRETHQSAHALYLEHQQSANSYKPKLQAWEEATKRLENAQETLEALQQQVAQLLVGYDEVQVQQMQAAYQEAQEQSITLRARLPEKQKRLVDLQEQVAKLSQIQEKSTLAQDHLKERQRIDRFIKFSRKAYKEAGPKITERYLQNISREADRLFRELLNRPNVALEWTRDYEILVREGAHTRRLVNLSGGEQMCAALAVRLALLKVLADVDVAFFDEPTTNMDRQRRLQLAEAIGNIKTFRQLFVISHDDTFEQVTENVILVEREV